MADHLDDETAQYLMRPAMTPQEREHQLISLAADLAERQLREGSASSQVITHFLRLGSSREELEQKRMGVEIDLMGTKQEAIKSHERLEALYTKALEAMVRYEGKEDEQDPGVE